jgi:hypothetical protein
VDAVVALLGGRRPDAVVNAEVFEAPNLRAGRLRTGSTDVSVR